MPNPSDRFPPPSRLLLPCASAAQLSQAWVTSVEMTFRARRVSSFRRPEMTSCTGLIYRQSGPCLEDSPPLAAATAIRMSKTRRRAPSLSACPPPGRLPSPLLPPLLPLLTRHPVHTRLLRLGRLSTRVCKFSLGPNSMATRRCTIHVCGGGGNVCSHQTARHHKY